MKQLVTFRALLPVSEDSTALSRLEEAGALGNTAITILKGLNQIVQDNCLGATVVKLMLEADESEKYTQTIMLRPSARQIADPAILQSSIRLLDLRPSLEKRLADHGITTIAALCDRSRSEIMGLRRISKVGLGMIEKALETLGLQLAHKQRR